MSRVKVVACKRAFTLVELLVVMAIIAILASMFAPVIRQVKTAVSSMRDSGNLRQLGFAMNLYTTDNEGMYPRNYYTTMDRPYWLKWTWRESILPYIKNGAAMTSQTEECVVASKGVFATPGVAKYRHEYGAHAGLVPKENYGNEIPSRGPMSIEAVSETLLLVTQGVNTKLGAGDYYLSVDPWYYGGGTRWPVFTGPKSGVIYDGDVATDDYADPKWRMPRYRYNNGANVAFVDGHVKLIAKGELDWCRHVYTPGFSEYPNSNDEDVIQGGFCPTDR